MRDELSVLCVMTKKVALANMVRYICSICFGVLLSSIVSADSESRPGELASTSSHEYVAEIIKGARIELDLVAIFESSDNDCDAKSFELVSDVTEGLVLGIDEQGLLVYQHSGTDTQEEELIVRMSCNVEKIRRITIKINELTARVFITSPTEGGVYYGDSIVVDYQISGAGYNHLHLSVDHGEHVSIYGNKGRYEFKNIEPGRHVIEATLARDDHRELGVTRKVIQFELRR